MNPQAAVSSALNGVGSNLAMFEKRPYINHRGDSVIAVPTGRFNKDGTPELGEKKIAVNATLRKDEWLQIDEELIESARERLVVVSDLQAAGLTHSTGGIGTQISEWENASEITDAKVTMDGESKGEKDKQEFGLNGVPVPVVHKEFSIGERSLMASRSRGASLDVTTGIEAARAVARTSENMVVNGGVLGAVSSRSDSYQIYGLTTFPSRRTYTISDWADDSGVTPADILADILGMIQDLETNARMYGPFTLYIPATFSFRFYQDLKADSDKTLMQRVLDDPRVAAVKVSDVLATDQALMVQMDRQTIDLAVGSDVTTIQWASPSGWTNEFQVFAVWAPRLKTDYDGRCGILHATVGS